MASSNGKGDHERKDPVYTVVRVVDSNTLKVIERGVTAKTQERACDKVVESLEVNERNGTFGAFTERHYWEDEYTVEHVVQTRKKGRQTRIAVAPEPTPVDKPEPEPTTAA